MQRLGRHSPSAIKGPLGGVLENGYGLGATILVEVLLTALLVFVVLSATDQVSDVLMAGVAIGFTLAVIHLISIPIDNTSVNPARSLAVAPYQVARSASCGCSSCSRSSVAPRRLVYRLLFGTTRRLFD